MSKKPRRLKLLFFFFMLLFLTISALTNPSKEDYIEFDEARTGIPVPDSVRIAEADFFLFSIYAPVPRKTVDEYGVTHLGIMGHFIKVSNGQFDESIWERFLK